MEGFNITINGKHICTAGIQDDGILDLDVSVVKLSRNDDNITPEIVITVHGVLGIPQDSSEDFDASDRIVWLNQSLNVGDEIRIQIVDTPHSDPPQQQTRHYRYEGCAFCGKKRTELSDSKIVAGAGANICKTCVDSYRSQIPLNGEANPLPELLENETMPCSFCGKTATEIPLIFPGQIGKTGICEACVKNCHEIFQELSQSNNKG